MKPQNRAPIRALLICLVFSITGCATASKGSSQVIRIGSVPEKAVCSLTRDGAAVGKVTTPGAIKVTRSRVPINVLCTKEGYDEARSVLNSSTTNSPMVVGLGVIGAATAVGALTDKASGADTQYQGALMIKLEPLSAADLAASPAAPPAPKTPPPPPPTASDTQRGPYDGTYEGSVDVLQTNISPPVAHERDFSLQVKNGVVTGTVRHALCDQPGEVFLVIDSAGSIKGRANTENTTGCTERMAMVEGHMEGGNMHLMLRLRGNPDLVLKQVSTSTTPPVVASTPSPRPFDGEYKGGLEVASGDLRQLWIRVQGSKATGTSRVALCPTPGAVSMSIDPSGTISGEADLQTSTSCTPRKATLSGHAKGKRLVMTASFADGSKSREFTLNHLNRGEGVGD